MNKSRPQPQHTSSQPAGDGELGARLERLLRAAEQEAAQIREAAERRAAALLTEAHAEIARHQQDRRREWQKREAAVATAQERSTIALAAASEQAAQLTEAAEEEAQRIRDRAHLRAREASDAAAQAIEHARRDAAQELERLTQLRDAARAEIRRLLRSLDGVRDALAYELDTPTPRGSPQAAAETRLEATERSGDRPQTSAAAAAIGRRRGDLHRTRHSGLSAAGVDRAEDSAPG